MSDSYEAYDGAGRSSSGSTPTDDEIKQTKVYSNGYTIEHEVFGWEYKAFTRDSHVILSEYLLIFSVLLCLCLVLQHKVHSVWKWRYLPESGATLLLSMLLGVVIRCTYTGGANFNLTHLGFSPRYVCIDILSSDTTLHDMIVTYFWASSCVFLQYILLWIPASDHF